MDRSQVAHLNRIAKFLKISPGKINLNKENVSRNLKWQGFIMEKSIAFIDDTNTASNLPFLLLVAKSMNIPR